MDHSSTTLFVKPKRTTFITVLCVLTFLGSAYGILSGFLAYSKGPEITTKAKANMEKQKNNPEARKMNPQEQKMQEKFAVFLDAEKLQKNAIASIVANVITFLGGFLMFRMNRIGFWIYVVGTVTGVIAPIFIFGQDSLAGLFSFGTGFVGLIFIVMYAFNLRDMKPQPVYD